MDFLQRFPGISRLRVSQAIPALWVVSPPGALVFPQGFST
jgi:hypothetical protein